MQMILEFRQTQNVKYSVLAGFATFENQTFWIQKTVVSVIFDKENNRQHGLYVIEE